MKILLLSLVILIIFGKTQMLNAQNKKFDFSGLKPVVQVFGTTYFNIENNNFNYGIGRAHLGFKYEFNNKWSAKIILDRGRPTRINNIVVTDTTGNVLPINIDVTEGAYYTMFLKFASLQWKVNSKLRLQAGAILENHYITQEIFWGLRYVSQTFQDLYWHLPSSDLGFITYYKINKVFSVDAAITNGEGPRINQDSFGKLKYAIGIDINPLKNLQTRLYYHNRQSGQTGTETEQMFSAFAGYKLKDIARMGVEFNYMSNLNNFKDLESYGYSVFGIYSLKENIDLFLRFDHLIFNIPTNFISDIYIDRNSIISGVSYSPINRINLSLNYHAVFQQSKNLNLLQLSMEFKI